VPILMRLSTETVPFSGLLQPKTSSGPQKRNSAKAYSLCNADPDLPSSVASVWHGARVYISPFFSLADAYWGLAGKRLPITSPDTIISTRRFNCRPAAVLLSATGSAFPIPRASTLLEETPELVR